MSSLSNLPANNQTERNIKQLAFAVQSLTEAFAGLGSAIELLRHESSALIGMAEKMLRLTEEQSVVLQSMPDLTQDEIDFFKATHAKFEQVENEMTSVLSLAFLAD